MTKRNSLSAEDFAKELSQDREYQDRLREKDATLRSREGEVALAAQPILDELATANYPVASISEIADKYAPLPRPLVDVLQRWIGMCENEAVQEQLVRSLAASRGPFDGYPLIHLFEATQSSHLRYAIANTLATASVQGIGPWLLTAVRRQDYGIAREMLALAAARHSPPEQVNPVLVELLDELPGHAAAALSESGTENELAVLEEKYEEAKSWVKKEIGKALSVIRRRLAAQRDGEN